MAFQKPPLGAAVNWSHPLAQGLEALWLMNEATGNRLHDVTRHGHSGTFNGLVDNDWVANIHGTALEFDAITKWVEVTTSPRLAVMDELTVFALVIRRGDNPISGGRIISKASGAGSDDYYINQAGPIAFHTPRFRIRTVAGGTVTIGSAGTTVEQDDVYAFIGTWEGAAGAMDFYVTNLTTGFFEVITGTNAGTLNDDGQNIGIGRHIASDTRAYVGEIIMGGISRRKWTRADAELFTAHPYSMMAELEPQRVFFVTFAQTVQSPHESLVAIPRTDQSPYEHLIAVRREL